jgi:16S rRNA (cytidine1402-2'-O)-methyltransferase
VQAIPGASAALAALSVAALPAGRFTFVGFLPRKAGARTALLERLAEAPETLVFFEAPGRLAATLEELGERLGPRRACVARELTKLHEEVARGSLPELAERFASGARGEVTLVVEGADRIPARPAEELDEKIRERLAAGGSSRDIARELVGSGLGRREIYERVLALRADAEMGREETS